MGSKGIYQQCLTCVVTSCTRPGAMSSDDDEEVYIQQGKDEEAFNVADANSAKKVQERFCLPHEPACVFTKTNKRVSFGKLKGGKLYKLGEAEKIPDTKEHTQNAMIMANAVYKEDPKSYLDTASNNHTIDTIAAISQHSPQKVVLAVGKVGEKRTLYVAFRGTASWDDAVADLDIALRAKDAIPGGKFHSGFDRRSSVLPMEHIVSCARMEDCDTIITCGHSLGGAVSSITAIDLKLHLGKKTDLAVYNITFGSPFFANDVVRQKCKDERFDHHMIHYVGHKDIVPGILSLGHTIAELERKLNDLTGWHGT